MSHGESGPSYSPATFAERGVAVPLTTPLLSGARVRLKDRSGLELVVPKASGGRGDYVVPWRNIADLCRPGVHDSRLLAQVGSLSILSPATVREAAWRVAAEGFAGRHVRLAAGAAVAATQEAQLLTDYQLVHSLVRQMTRSSRQGVIPPAQVEPLVKEAIGLLSVRLNRDAEAITGALRGTAALLAPIGLADRIGTARVPVLLVAMQGLRQAVDAMPAPTRWITGAVHLVTKMIDVTLACLTQTLAEARSRVDNVPELIRAWLADPAATTAALSRPDWLGDGWNWLCQLWSLAETPNAQVRALDEIVLLLPNVPREAFAWGGYGHAVDLPPRPARRTEADGGEVLSIIDAIKRNETLLAMAA